MWKQETNAESRVRLNDEEREDWVNNDERLYRAFIASGKTMRAFIRANRSFIDGHIKAVLEGGRT